MTGGDDLEHLAREAAQHRNIPGLSLAVLRGDDVRAAAYGVLNVATGVAVTEDALFQVGSITKIFTGTLAMQLVDAGALELDAPVARYLPDLHIAGERIRDAITIRSLLTHTSGIAGDFFIDSGRNDDATQRYVERCAELDYVTEPGRFSYCNSGYAILGRAIEVVTGASWASRLRSSLLDPLGIVALLDPEDAMLYRVAAGHVLDERGAIRLTPTPFLPRGCEAAGSRLTMSARSLLAFARLHLRDGVGPGGARLLSERSVRAMRDVGVRPPVSAAFDGYGLAWSIHDRAHPPSLGHNGATVGQSAFLRVFPQLDLAVAALTNVTSGAVAEAFDEIVAAVLAPLGERYDAAKPRPAGGVAFDGSALAARYDTYMERIVVEDSGGALRATVARHNNEQLAPLRERRLELHAVNEREFVATDTLEGSAQLVGFTDFEDGRPAFLFWGGRLAARQPASPLPHVR